MTSTSLLTFELLRRSTGVLSGGSPMPETGPDFPWERWSASLIRDGLAPLFGHYFMTDGTSEQFIQAETRKLCMDRFLASAAQNTRLLHTASGIVQSLADAGVAAVVLKGAHLAEAVYPHCGCRPMGDIDLLVRPQHYRDAARVLSGLGYSSPEPFERLPNPVSGPSLNASMWRPPRAGCPPVHLHWHLFNSGQPLGLPVHFDEERVWSQTRVFRLSGTEALGLGRRELILHLFEHALRHGYDRLLLLADISALYARDGLAGDQAGIDSDARDYALLPAFRVGRALVACYCGAGDGIRSAQQSPEDRLTLPERRLVSRFPARRASRLLVYSIYAAECRRRRTLLRFLRMSLWPGRNRLVLQDGGSSTRGRYLLQAARHLWR